MGKNREETIPKIYKQGDFLERKVEIYFNRYCNYKLTEQEKRYLRGLIANIKDRMAEFEANNFKGPSQWYIPRK